MSEFTPAQIRQVLDLELGDNDSGEPTVRKYLLRLLGDVWRDGEGFDGKRLFGNSSWECELYVPMIRAGLVTGSLDSDGYLERLDEKSANALIAAAIQVLDAPRDAAAPEPAKVITVTTETGSIRRYAAPNFGMLHDGTLVIGDKTGGEDLRVDAALAPGRWSHVHKDGTMAGDDRDAKALVIARRALSRIYGHAHGENDAEDLAAVVWLADEALAELAELGYE